MSGRRKEGHAWIELSFAFDQLDSRFAELFADSPRHEQVVRMRSTGVIPLAPAHEEAGMRKQVDVVGVIVMEVR
jgi:hypothetical protein